MEQYTQYPQASDAPPTILVVEDSKGLNRLIRKRLEREGFLTVQAFRGAEALALVEAHPNVLILLDYVLPDMTAREIVEILSEKYGASLPFVMMTGHGDERIAVEMMKLGARDYIIKQGNFIDMLPRVITRVWHEVQQTQRLERAEQAQRESERRFRETLENVSLIAIMLDLEGRVTFCNEYFLQLTGWQREEIVGEKWFERVLPDNTRNQMRAEFRRTFIMGQPSAHYLNEILTRRGERLLISWSNTVLRDPNGEIIGTNSLGEDITEQKRTERSRQLVAQVLSLLNSAEDEPQIVRKILLLIKDFSEADAVGIRFRKDDDFPYYETIGFSQTFVKKEDSLFIRDHDNCVLRDADGQPFLGCLCGKILSGEVNSSLSYFTPGGSFWTNDATDVFESLTCFTSSGSSMRNNCHEAGYESVALIPLRSHGDIIGLLQLNAFAENVFTGELIRFFEDIGASIGIAMTRKQTEEKLLHLGKAVETMHLGVTITDLDRKIVYTNPADAALHGFTVDELLGQYGNIFAPTDLRQPFSIKQIEENKNWIRESLNIRKDGTCFPVQLSSDVVNDAQGQAIAIVTTCEDISERKKAEETIQHERNLLRTLIDNIPDYIFVKDEQGRFLINNRAHLLACGALTQEELTGSTDADIYLPELADKSWFDDQQIFESGEPLTNLEEMVKDKNRKEQWFLTTKVPLRDEQGKTIGIVGISRDISEQKQIENMLKQQTATLQKRVKELHCLFDISHLIETPDIPLEEIFASAAYLLPTAWQFPNVACTRIVVNEREYATANFRVCPWRQISAIFVRNKDVGTVEVGYLEACPESDEGPFLKEERSLLNSIAERLGDVIERKEAAKSLQLTLNDLDLRVKERTHELSQANALLHRQIAERKRTEIELQRAKELAETASQAKSVFLANMSHELRTPLNAILGYAQILKVDPSISVKQCEGLLTIQKSGEHLLQMINDILDLSKIEAGRMELILNEFHLPYFLRNIEDMLQIRAKQQGIVFTCESNVKLPVGVYADEKRLREVLLNLLSNAVKFTRQGGCVVFRIDRLQGEQEENGESPAGCVLQFSITDTGIGIAPEELENIFLPFHQSGEQKYSIEGTGLGLAISHKLVQMMGGELHAESVLGEGSCFRFCIELPEIGHYVPSVATLEPKIIGYAGPQQTVLVIDDLAENRKVLLQLLLPLGFHVIEASDGAAGLESARKFQPDVILLDLRMPEMDGFEVARRIRQDKQGPQPAVLAVSASAFAETRRKSLEAGCDDFIAKPFQVHELLQLLQRHLQLDWIYEEIAKKPVDFQSARSELVALFKELPQAERQKFVENVERGNIKGILRQLDRMAELGERFFPLVTELRGLARGFQIDMILEFLEEQ